MKDPRRDPRGRNNRNKKKFVSSKPMIITFSVIIILLLVILVYKNQEEKIRLAREQEERMNKIYVLFEEVNDAAESIEIGEEGHDEKNPDGTPNTKPKDTTIKIVTVGDIICETPLLEDAYNKGTGAYDFSYIFSSIKKYTLDADITLGLLETNFVENKQIFQKSIKTSRVE